MKKHTDTQNQTRSETKTTEAPAAPPMTALQKLLVKHGKRLPPTPPRPALTEGVEDAHIMNLPNNLTASSIAKLTESLDPAHPAAQLSAMNEKFLSLMVAEDDQTCLLRRQAQTLDTLFHTMLNFSITPSTTAYEQINLNTYNIGVALQSQRQCYDVVKSLKGFEYTDALTHHIASKRDTPSRHSDAGRDDKLEASHPPLCRTNELGMQNKWLVHQRVGRLKNARHRRKKHVRESLG